MLSIQRPHPLGRSSGFPPHSGYTAWTIKLERTWLCPVLKVGSAGSHYVLARMSLALRAAPHLSGTLAQHCPIFPAQSDRKSTINNSRHEENCPNTPVPEYAILFPTSFRQSIYNILMSINVQISKICTSDIFKSQREGGKKKRKKRLPFQSI